MDSHKIKRTYDRVLDAAEQHRRETTKHQDFDKLYPQLEKFFWWLACRSYRVLHKNDFHKKLERRQHGPEEYIGEIVIRFNRMLYSFDPSMGKITTLLTCHVYSDLYRKVTRFFSIASDMNAHRLNMGKEEIHQADLELSVFDRSCRFYRTPSTDIDYIREILDSFDSMQDLWRYITTDMKNRDKYILYAYYKHSQNLRSLGERLGITKERVRQLLENAKAKIRTKLKTLESFVRLFKKSEESVDYLDQDEMEEFVNAGKTNKRFREDTTGKQKQTMSDEVWFEVTSFCDNLSPKKESDEEVG